MDTTNENIQKTSQFPIGTSLKTNKIIIFCINALVMIPLIVQNYSLIGLGISAAILLISAYIVIFRSESSLPAGAYYTTFVFADFYIYLGLQYEVLKTGFTAENLSLIFEKLINSPMCLYLLFGGAIVGFIGINKHKVTWIS